MGMYTDEIKKEAIKLLNEGNKVCEVSEILGIPARTIYSWRKIFNEFDPLNDLVESNTNLAKRNQRLMDINRIERKSFRENTRIENAITDVSNALINILETHKFSEVKPVNKNESESTRCGILQISDTHLNELVDIPGNQYDMTIASKRLKKFTSKAIDIFNNAGVENVVIIFTGDLINSDRRMDEMMAKATNRAGAMFCAVDIFQQLIQLMSKSFEVTVGSICGNESRIQKDIGWVDVVASDNFDYMIYKILEKLFEDRNDVIFLPMEHPLELVMNINGSNILAMHGHSASRTASNAKIENEVHKVIARYVARGIKIDYTIMGHVHSAYISDRFARSASTVGQNAYAENALNLSGRASQNLFIVESDGSINGMRIDLQNYDEYEPFNFSKDVESYIETKPRPNIAMIQQVLV